MTAKSKVIFIVGSSHSGSTLLDLILNAHPDVIGMGELKQLTRPPEVRRGPAACTCGALTVGECAFWTKVGQALRCESPALKSLNVEDYNNPETFRRDNARLFGAIKEVSGKEIVVDASKSWRRLELLLEIKDLDLFPVFLHRDPRGQVPSEIRSGRKRAGLPPQPPTLPEVVNAAAQYFRKNRTIYRKIRHSRHFMIQYERLAQQPANVLESLMRYVGLEFHPDQLNWREQESHNIGGNMMRFTATTSRLILDEKWRTQLSPMQQAAILFTTFPARLPFVRLHR